MSFNAQTPSEDLKQMSKIIDPLRARNRVVKTEWLHVAEDNTEHRYERCPTGADYAPTLHIVRSGRFERTRTFDVIVPGDKYLQRKSVRPRGQGWVRTGHGFERGNPDLCTGERRWTGWRRVSS